MRHRRSAQRPIWRGIELRGCESPERRVLVVKQTVERARRAPAIDPSLPAKPRRRVTAVHRLRSMGRYRELDGADYIAIIEAAGNAPLG